MASAVGKRVSKLLGRKSVSDALAGGKNGEVDELDQACVNAIRTLSVEMVQQANSGHPGAPIGCAPMAYALFTKVMNYAPSQPKWFNRDRFILSNGHACALLYSMLHLTGYDRPTIEDIKKFRQIDSVTAGHPENHLLEGVEIATGPLGQGISNAVGMAAAATHLGAVFNEEGHELINNFTYVICGDGCLQEGVSSEASSLAGHLKLGRLIVLYDDNNITIDGDTSVSFTEDVAARYRAYGWQVLEVADGNSAAFGSLLAAIEEGKACTDKPTLIKVKTTIGFQTEKQGTPKVHGAPLGWDEIKRLREVYGMDPDAHFEVPENVLEHMRKQREKGEELVADWNAKLEAYRAAFPDKAADLERRMAGELPEDWAKSLPEWSPEDGALASRKSSEAVLNAVAKAIPNIVGGSADLTSSNLTFIQCSHDYQANSRDGRYFRFGVREHGMAAMCNGMAAYGGLIPFGATFLNFAGYALGAMRLSALCEFRVLYIMTHDSIGLGEDGPTHQPIGMLATLRSIPNMYVFRPADANEVSGSYKAALGLAKSPSTFSLSRQNLPNLEHSSVDKVAQGGYVVYPCDGTPSVTFVATGSEVPIAIDAARALADEDVAATVVSMPCMKLFDSQSAEYKKSVFLEGVPVIAVEAASPQGWQKYSHAQICMESFGKSGPGPELYEYFGFTPDNLASKAKILIEKMGGRAQWLVDAPW